MSDTPRTDALMIEHWGSLKPFAGHPVAEFARKLERELAARTEALAPTWIPVAERQPKGEGWVLCSHPVLGLNGIAIRGGQEVRNWANDPQDKSMLDACWMPLPSSHFAASSPHSEEK